MSPELRLDNMWYFDFHLTYDMHFLINSLYGSFLSIRVVTVARRCSLDLIKPRWISLS